jgi:predicted RNA binding protein YcfA (HicA-like mRNA interferase family)
MTSSDKLLERFKRLPSDFTFDELDRLLTRFGYERSNKGKTSGSRIIYKNNNNRPIMIHRPHPGNIIKIYAMKQILDHLRDLGYIKEDVE